MKMFSIDKVLDGVGESIRWCDNFVLCRSYNAFVLRLA
ncbi:unnamed protein product [Amoebophrya sp. A25]|nr:unnamed protein product [Amoebophrya sp. A25]|eukprot:GSA25T00019868001.1